MLRKLVRYATNTKVLIGAAVGAGIVYLARKYEESKS